MYPIEYMVVTIHRNDAISAKRTPSGSASSAIRIPGIGSASTTEGRPPSLTAP